MERTIKILNQLSRMALNSYPIQQIESSIKDLGTNAQISYTIHPGNSIFRVRPNEPESERFETRSQLSYRPEKYNIDFQRSSTPNETMFYGSIVPEKLAPTDIDIGRATACFEAAKTFRNNWFSSIEKITFSRWEVIQDINVVMIAYSPPFLRVGSILTELNEDFRKQIGEFDPDLLKKALVINEFIGYEFSKNTIRGDYDYLISALYTDIMVRNGFDGVFYPSVKSDGRGYNLCLTKNCADSNLRLIAAGEGTIVKCGYKTQILNLAQSRVTDDAMPFEYEELPRSENAKEVWNKLLDEQA